jgi:hypothetical protein
MKLGLLRADRTFAREAKRAEDQMVDFQFSWDLNNGSEERQRAKREGEMRNRVREREGEGGRRTELKVNLEQLKRSMAS